MVDSLISVAKDSLIKILQDEVALQMGVPEEVEGLLRTFTTLEAMLQDAEGRRVNDKSVMDWLEKLKDLAYDVDGILDEWRTEDLRSQADEGDASHFSLKKDFDVKRVTKLIIESATKQSCDSLALDPMQDRLRGMLHGKRFLLVLNDVWITEREKWDQLKVPLQAGAPGSRVIVTTRSANVASTAGSAHVHELSALSDDECWSLFSHYAFGQRNVEEYSELEKIGREIVQKCGGVPLAAKALGSVMCTKGTRREWDIILQSETWSLQCGILPALLLSYYDLPSPLKQCFAYCSLFPKDFLMEPDKLVKLWMAQGFIRSEGCSGMEDVGGQHIDQLQRIVGFT